MNKLILGLVFATLIIALGLGLGLGLGLKKTSTNNNEQLEQELAKIKEINNKQTEKIKQLEAGNHQARVDDLTGELETEKEKTKAAEALKEQYKKELDASVPFVQDTIAFITKTKPIIDKLETTTDSTGTYIRLKVDQTKTVEMQKKVDELKVEAVELLDQ